MTLVSKKIADVAKKVCVSCGTCTKYCPKEAISIIKGCFAEVNADLCIGCGKCANVCPVGCIAMKVR